MSLWYKRAGVRNPSDLIWGVDQSDTTETVVNLTSQRRRERGQGPLRPVLAALRHLGIEVESALAVQRCVPFLSRGQVLVVNIARPLVEIFNIAGGNCGTRQILNTIIIVVLAEYYQAAQSPQAHG